MGGVPADDGSRRRADGAVAGLNRDLIEQLSSHAVFVLDSEGTIVTWPEPARRLYGYESPAVLGEGLDVLLADEERSGRSAGELLEATGTSGLEAEHWHRRADGSVFWAACALSPLGDGQLEGYGVVARDASDRRRYERTLERRNDRLKEFTDVLAHDLRNPLGVIGQSLEFYRETGEEAYLETIEETTDRMERLVDDLLRVARQGDLVTDPEATDLEQVVETAWQGFGDTGGRATLECEDVRSVCGAPDRLHELFENLFRNAVEHGSTGSRTSSDDAVEHGGADVSVRVGPLEDGFYVVDDGPGIPPDVRSEVFDHGFTTTEDGTGYGLSIVRTIGNAHGWDVTASEGESGGARFEFTGVEFVGDRAGDRACDG